MSTDTPRGRATAARRPRWLVFRLASNGLVIDCITYDAVGGTAQEALENAASTTLYPLLFPVGLYLVMVRDTVSGPSTAANAGKQVQRAAVVRLTSQTKVQAKALS